MDEFLDNLENGNISKSQFVSLIFSPESKSSPQNAIALLDQRSKKLERELRSEVCANSDELLQNASDIKYFRDNVISLKSQVQNSRREVEAVSAKIIDPFHSVQENAKILSENYQKSRKIRLLLTFISRIRQTKDKLSITKITGVNSDIKKLCELIKIAQTGELDNIDAFQKLWALKKPMCDELLRLADNQMINGIEKNDLISSSNAACIYVHVGTIENVSCSLFKRISNVMFGNKQKIEKSTPENIISTLKNEFKDINNSITKLNMLFQCCETTLKKSPDADLPEFLSKINPNIAITDYSNYLSQLLVKKSQQNPNIATEIANNIPLVRMNLLAMIEKKEYFKIIIKAFTPFQDSFLKTSLQELRKGFFRNFSLNHPTDPSMVIFFCETIQNKLSKYDNDLLLKFKPSIIQLANDFMKMNNHENPSLQKQAETYKESVTTGLVNIMKNLYGEDSSKEVLSILS